MTVMTVFPQLIGYFLKSFAFRIYFKIYHINGELLKSIAL